QPAVDALWSVAAALKPGMSVQVRSDNGSLRNPVPPTGLKLDVAINDRVTDMVNAHLRNWDGGAAGAFKTHFLDHIGNASDLQGQVAASLALTLEAHKEIRQRANSDVWTIGNNTLHAIDKMKGICHAGTASTALTVFGAVASVLTASSGIGFALASITLGNTV